MIKISMILLIINSPILFGQTYYWSGNTGDNDFFNENNWYDKDSGESPENGSIDPNKTINFDLHITCKISTQESLNLPYESIILESSKKLNITDGTLDANSLSGGTLILNENSYVTLYGDEPLSNNIQVKFNSELCWLRLVNIRPDEISNDYSSSMFYNNNLIQYPSNIRYDNYYNNGTVIRPQDSNTSPLKVFSDENLTGKSEKILINQIFSGDDIPNQLNNDIESFELSRGYMLTIAENNDGTGKSKVFIASETDIQLNSVPLDFKNKISFLRVIPWNWVSKKGTAGDIAGLNNTWFYKWSNNGSSDLNREYSPMSWGHNATSDNDIIAYRNKYKSTHVLGFNEPDNCNGQSGQYGNLCDVNVAIEFYRNLMKTGLRLVSPACRQGGETSWLNNFNNLAIQNDIRIDVIAVHWYDWSSNPQNSVNTNPILVFNRFKQFLENVYNLYNLPIWITEFNANKHRTQQVNRQFLELALPYLESLEYVERYAWFQPHGVPIATDPGNGEFFFDNDPSQLTELGVLYYDHVSTPSITENFYIGPDNLNYDTIQNDYSYECNSSTVFTKKNQLTLEKSDLFYPNPAEKIIYLNSSSYVDEVEIYSINGINISKKVRNGLIDVSDLNKGVYIIKFQNKSFKLIKI